ncbi:MAG: AMP-binding protein [Elainellaceae cyanobacterium]
MTQGRVKAMPAGVQGNITDSMAQWADSAPYHTALVIGDRTWSYRALVSGMQQIAAYVARLTTQEKDAAWRPPFGAALPWVALVSSNRIEGLQVFLGTAMAGGVTMVLSPRWGMAQLQRVLDAYPPDWLVGEANLLESLPLGGMRTALSPSGDLTPWPPQAAITPPPAAHLDRPFYACFTSGTTGQPKGIVKTHRSWLDGLAASRVEFDIRPTDQVFVPGALSHSLSLYAAVEALSAGSTLHLLPHPIATAAVHHLQQHPITAIVAVPTLLHLLTTEAIAQDVRFPTVRLIISGGAKLTAQLTQRLRQVFPKAQIIEYYGASELGFVSIRRENDAMPSGSVGRAFAGVEVSIQRQDGSGTAPPGALGWVGVRSTLVCAGYLQESPTGQGFRQVNGWWTVGDRGWQDEQGHLYLAGRQDMMVCAGVNVYPAAVEAALLLLSEIGAAVVLGLRDDCRGDVIHAVLVWQDTPLDRRSLRQRLRPHLDRHALPRRFYAVSELPLTASGKVARSMLTEQIGQGELAPREIR